MSGGNADKQRQTWSIGELCREFGVTARALRFYEQKGLLKPQRQGWTRIYSARDRQRLQMILRSIALIESMLRQRRGG